jgi:uncharacterized membrane protein YbhN (UPF0104 family)
MMLAILLLMLIAWAVDLQATYTLFRNTQWQWVIACLLLVQVQVVISAIRWRVTAGRLGQYLSVPRAVREYYLATLGNLSLPGGVAGDAARIYRNRRPAGVRIVAQVVMIERLAGQVALVTVAIAGWLLWPAMLQVAVPVLAGKLLLAALAFALLMALLAWLLAGFAASRIARFVRSFGPALYRTWVAQRQWLVQGVLSLGIVATYLLVFAACALALQQPMSVVAILSIVPLVLLSMVIPLSIGGWGIREAVAATLWPMAGLSPEAGVATSVLYGLVSMLGTIPGALMAWKLSHREC